VVDEKVALQVVHVSKLVVKVSSKGKNLASLGVQAHFVARASTRSSLYINFLSSLNQTDCLKICMNYYKILPCCWRGKDKLFTLNYEAQNFKI
jgi:hypothetical protein